MRLDDVGDWSNAKSLHTASFVSLESTLGVVVVIVTFATGGAYVEAAAATKARAAIFSSFPAVDIIMVCSDKTVKLS
jgi:hypothetical protein